MLILPCSSFHFYLFLDSHLPAPYSYGMLGPNNAREVLSAATFFGLPDLASYAYEFCKSSINIDTLVSWVQWCDAQDNSSSSQNVVIPPSHVQNGHGLGLGIGHPQRTQSAFSTLTPMTSEMSDGATAGSDYGSTRASSASYSSSPRKESGWSSVNSAAPTDWVSRLKHDV